MTGKVWVLTSEHNDYDQHGAYFLAVFAAKPSVKALAEAVAKHHTSVSNDVMEALAFLEHLLTGGGRREWEDVWFKLEEVDFLPHD